MRVAINTDEWYPVPVDIFASETGEYELDEKTIRRWRRVLAAADKVCDEYEQLQVAYPYDYRAPASTAFFGATGAR